MPRIYLVLAILSSITLLMSWSGNPPDGKTNAPGDGLCTECHSLNGGTQNGSIAVTGMPAMIQPSTAYLLTITNSNPNGIADRAGFQMTILNSSNQKAGTMSSPSMNSVVTASGGRDYWEHNPSQLYPASNMVSWTVTWTSPVGPANTTITAYSAGNVANNNGNPTGDLIVTSTVSGTLMGGGSPLEIEISSITHVLCNGGNTGSATAAAAGGTMPYTYTWSNGGSGATINNVIAGTYTVTVTDNDGTTATTTAVITQPPLLVLQTPAITHVSCFGGSNGAITASASGGATPHSFNWSTGASGPTISGLIAGSYSVTVTDNNGCTKMATYMIAQPAQLQINLENITHETCSGADDGTITISASGGTSPYFAEWSNGFIGNTINGLTPDQYSVTVTDINNCTQTASYVINPGGTINVTVQQIQHVTCNGGNNGSISILANGGSPPYTYAWSNGGSGPEITNLAAGNYLVTVSDVNGCQIVNLYTINQPNTISLSITSAGQNLCAGDSLVNLTAVVSGDFPPFTGAWSNGVNGLVNNNLPAGTYTVTVTDAMGCTKSASTVVTSPAPLVVTVMTTSETAVGEEDGTATANVSGGTTTYTYAWSNSETTATIVGLAPGTYSVTVTDMNGCTATGSGQVNAFVCSFDVGLGADLILCENDTITISPSVSGETGGLTYLWSNGATTSSILVSSGGEYCVTVTDSLLCEGSDCIVISIDSFPLIDCPVVYESIPGANDGSISCDSVTGIITYEWSTGATTPSISDLAPGEYCVTMTNALGCMGSQCFTVDAAVCLFFVNAIVTDALCAGDSTGSIMLTVDNALPPITFQWSNGDTTDTVSNLEAGDYDVTITDGEGCSNQLSYHIAEPLPIVIHLDSIIHIISGPGGIFISITGGVLPYMSTWFDPLGNILDEAEITNLSEAGYYQVVVQDSNGCMAELDSIFVQTLISVDPQPVFKTLKVYPVPVQDILWMELETPIQEVLISGIDGRLNARIKNPMNNMLHVGDLSPGWYLARIYDGQSWYIARFVK